MRIIVAYLAACMVAAILCLSLLAFEVGVSASSPVTIRLMRLDGFLALITLPFSVAGAIGGILALPWLSMYFVFEVEATRRNCILFGAYCGLIAMLAVQYATNDWSSVQSRGVDLWQTGRTAILMVLSGIAAGATYWAIAGHDRT